VTLLQKCKFCDTFFKSVSFVTLLQKCKFFDTFFKSVLYMLILVSPQFSNSNPDDANFLKNINDIENTREIDIEIKKQLTTLFPDSVVERVEGITKYYTISSLAEETRETADRWLIPKYFEKLREYRSAEPVTIKVDGRTLQATLYFDTNWKEIEGVNFDDSYIAQILDGLQSDGESFLGFQIDNIILNDTTYLGAKFSGSVIEESTFINAQLIGADFTDSDFYDCNFAEADLRYTDLSVAVFNSKCILTQANLRKANLTGTNFNGANLSGADLRYTTLTEATNFTGCNLVGTKFSGNNWENTIHGSMEGAVFSPEEEEDEAAAEDEAVAEDEAAAEERENDLVLSAEKENYIKKFNAKLPKESKETKILPPLAAIDPTDQITTNDTHTYADLVAKLTPDIKSKKLPISQMEPYKWYGIASLGTTSTEVWASNAVEEPTIGKVFKCVLVPPTEECEAVVYESTPACMAVHELGRMLQLPNLFMTFEEIVGEDELQFKLDTLQWEVEIYESISKEAMVEKIMFILHQLLVFLLGLHNADEAPDAWTHVFDDIDKRNQLVKHAIFNREEGIMYHPWFLTHLTELLAFCMFIEKLPLQMQVKWAQHYILEFITGYGQELETFDPKHRTEMGFIASCINGNLEKLLLSVRTAITHFYPLHLEEETPEQKLQNMKNAVTGSEFQKYYETVEDIEAGPSIDGYKTYIRNNTELGEELKTQYLSFLEEPCIKIQINHMITSLSGGRGKKKRMNKRKTKKNKNKKKTTLKHKTTNKRRKTIKRKKRTIGKK
jgi:uncharacterized protein YjbI with pentapeptide repeats